MWDKSLRQFGLQVVDEDPTDNFNWDELGADGHVPLALSVGRYRNADEYLLALATLAPLRPHGWRHAPLLNHYRRQISHSAVGLQGNAHDSCRQSTWHLLAPRDKDRRTKRCSDKSATLALQSGRDGQPNPDPTLKIRAMDTFLDGVGRARSRSGTGSDRVKDQLFSVAHGEQFLEDTGWRCGNL